MEVQTRSEETGIQHFKTLQEAFEHAGRDPSVWKISFFTETLENVRLVRQGDEWIYTSVEQILREYLERVKMR